VVMRALEKDRGRRYQRMAELERDLERLLTGDQNVGLPEPAEPPVTVPRRKVGQRWHLGVAGVLAIGVGLAVALVRTEDAPPPAPAALVPPRPAPPPPPPAPSPAPALNQAVGPAVPQSVDDAPPAPPARPAPTAQKRKPRAPERPAPGESRLLKNRGADPIFISDPPPAKPSNP